MYHLSKKLHILLQGHGNIQLNLSAVPSAGRSEVGLKLDSSREQGNVALNTERRQKLERNPGNIFCECCAILGRKPAFNGLVISERTRFLT